MSERIRRMGTRANTDPKGRALDSGATLRNMLVLVAAVLVAAATLHLADHALRGEIVEDNGLVADWNHSGWSFRNQVTPFTAALAIPFLFILAILLTLKGRLGSGSWLALAVVVGGVVVWGTSFPVPRRRRWGSSTGQTPVEAGVPLWGCWPC